MTWSESISAAIRYIEEHLAEPLSVKRSPAQRRFRHSISSADSPCSAA